MAITVGVLSDTRRRTLEALCDTFAPALEAPEGDEQTRAFYERARVAISAWPRRSSALLAQTAMPEDIEAFGQLLDAFVAQDCREPLARGAHGAACTRSPRSSPEAKLGVRQLRALTFLFFYGLPDESGRNANWDAIGYPGPRIARSVPRAGAEDDLDRAPRRRHARRSRRTCAWSAREPAAA